VFAWRTHTPHHVELLILDDLALHRFESTKTSDVYKLIVERHRNASTITNSNREPLQISAMVADPLLAQSAWVGMSFIDIRRSEVVLPVE